MVTRGRRASKQREELLIVCEEPCILQMGPRKNYPDFYELHSCEAEEVTKKLK